MKLIKCGLYSGLKTANYRSGDSWPFYTT